MQKLESNYDRESLEVSDEIPTHSLRYVLGRLHVLTPPEKVEKMIRQKIKRAGIPYSEEQIEQTVKAGLWIHAENLAEYKWVMKV